MLFERMYVLKHYTSSRGDSYGVCVTEDHKSVIASFDKEVVENCLKFISNSLQGGEVIEIEACVLKKENLFAIKLGPATPLVDVFLPYFVPNPSFHFGTYRWESFNEILKLARSLPQN